MKPRFTAWLLTLLLGVSGTLGVPLARASIVGVSYTVVIVDKSEAPRQEIAETKKSVRPRRVQNAPLIPDHSVAPAAPLDPSLFQRPPPAVS